MPEPKRLRASLRCPSSLERAQCSPVPECCWAVSTAVMLDSDPVDSSAGLRGKLGLTCCVSAMCHFCFGDYCSGFFLCVSVSCGEWSEASTHRRAPTGPQPATPRSGPRLRPLRRVLCGHASFASTFASWCEVLVLKLH